MDTQPEVTLTVREQKRLFVITEVLSGRWTAAKAADQLGLSVRQMRRLLAGYRRDGPAALVHGNRGRLTPRRLPPEIRDQVVRLVKASY
ncbi:MAG: helix-turn-helix domain-containing protein, partial [Anaerolineales bacterium]